MGTELWSFEKSREFAQKLKIGSQKEWIKYCTGKLTHLGAKPEQLPRNVQSVYKDKGWKGWPDFLGYEPKRKKK